MALTHLVDTSVLKRLSSPAVREALEPLVEAGCVARSSVADLGAGHSARHGREWDELLETTAHHFTGAEHVQRLLATRSQRDFDHIAHATGQSAQWIVPPGTVDRPRFGSAEDQLGIHR